MPGNALRPIRIEGGIAYVPLTQGYEAIIDAADVPLVEGANWQAHVSRKNGRIVAVYAVRNKGPRNSQRMIRMHRLIAGTPDGYETDHKDGDGLNNRRDNLRPATHSQNQANREINANNTSGFRGVSLVKRLGRWKAEIKVDRKGRHLGYFPTKEAAAAAYAEASAHLHGEFRRHA